MKKLNQLFDKLDFKWSRPPVATVSGLSYGARALFVLKLMEAGAGGPVLIITRTEDECRRFYKDLLFFSPFGFDSPVLHLLPMEMFENEVVGPDYSSFSNRVEVYNRLAADDPIILVASVFSIMQKSCHDSNGANNRLVLSSGSNIELESFAKQLLDYGYTRVDIVRQVGNFTIRGGVVDIFPPGYDVPFRLELFGDTVDSVREFDIYSQMTTVACREVSVGMLSGGSSGEISSIFSFFNKNGTIVTDGAVRSVAADTYSRFSEFYVEKRDNGDKEKFVTEEQFLTALDEYRQVRIDAIEMEHGASESNAVIRHEVGKLESIEHFFGQPSLSEKLDTLELLAGGHLVFLVCKDKGEVARLKELLLERGVAVHTGKMVDSLEQEYGEAAFVLLQVGELSAGFTFGNIIIASTLELFGKKRLRSKYHSQKKEAFLSSFDDLKTGDNIVHIDYGIGRYCGLARFGAAGNEKEFLKLEYDRNDILYVPVESLDMVQKYISADGTPPSLTRLGGTVWEKTRKKARKAVDEVVEGLLELYSARKVALGTSFIRDDHMQMEFESGFEYEETPDQMNAINDVKRDMESERVMDRLICGDVGYGKTEVMLRAAFKAVNSGMQAAVLAPTTLLVFQHYRTFLERFSLFPVKIEMLSRFRTAKESRQVMQGLESGEIDLVIGTHKLLQKECRFKKLGLLVVDEEQKFGVRHKEKLKELRVNVDMLTLTATPIPRTLQMSLFGMRDISTITTPPTNRMVVKTDIIRFRKNIIKDAILRELMRGGQIFFVHNRVHDIVKMGNLIKEMVPGIKIGVAHGQMGERELEQVVVGFINKEYDLLLSTSIIESGIDIPDANTIIINRADMFGLADLYQIRGRVGRSSRQGYAFLVVPEEGRMTQAAYERISAISDNSGSGAGFQIAMKDLEIRGAGHLLGSSQSGHLSGVGFELFMKMIDEAVNKIKVVDADKKPREDIAVDLGCSAYIPHDYIPQVQVRLNMYKRISAIVNQDELDLLELEFVDRFGVIPEQIEHLFESVKIKLDAAGAGIVKITGIASGFRIRFSPERELGKNNFNLLMEMKSRGELRLQSEFEIELPAAGDMLEKVCILSRFMQKMCKG